MGSLDGHDHEKRFARNRPVRSVARPAARWVYRHRHGGEFGAWPGQSAHSIHPGVIGTNLARSMGAMGKVFVFFLKLFSKTPAQGAATSVFAATAPELAGQSGAYLANCAVASSSPEGQDDELAARLWAASEQIVAVA
jgi:hypothetical protein